MKATLDLTPGQLYDKYPDIPSGYEVVKFSVPKAGDLYISRFSGSLNTAQEDHQIGKDTFRLIVRKVGLTEGEIANAKYTVTLDDVYSTKPTIPRGYYAVDFRPPTRGDVYLGVYGAVECADHSASDPRLILNKSS